MDPKLLFLLCLASFFGFSTAFLSSIAISRTANETVACALLPFRVAEANIACVCLENQHNFTLRVGYDGFDALAGGAGFVCAIRSSNSAIHCWDLYNVSNSRRISPGLPWVADFQAGWSQVCVLDQAGGLHWWRWHGFVEPAWARNLSSIAVGNWFFCGMLSGSGDVKCWEQGVDWTDVPDGKMRLVTAGSQHACGMDDNGKLVCWGPSDACRIDVPKHDPFEFVQLALGQNRSCALRAGNRTVVCWGDAGFKLPSSLDKTQFVHIHGKDTTFCGVVSSDYSVVCWDARRGFHVMLAFEYVLPGGCASTCPCQPLPGSGSLCQAGKFVCQPCVFSGTPPPAPCSLPPLSSKSTSRRAFLIVGCVGLAVGVACLIFLLATHVCRGHGCRVHDSGPLDPLPLAPESQPGQLIPKKSSPQLDKLESLGVRSKLEEFPLEMLIKATTNFSATFRIGSGSFGSVYEATLPDGRHVAIKRAEMPSPSAVYVKHYHQDNEHAFQAELALLSRLNHKNLVQLIGFCKDDTNGLEQVLVYEYMANKSLYEQLHKRVDSPLNGWIPRLRVALDTARGIEYLHTYAVPPIIHRDIKSGNILLDAGWTAKVADFGLSLMGPTDESRHLSLRAAGTVGYMDPEYYRLQQLTTKSDVYSFGVVLLELLTGYKAIHKDEDGSVPRNVVDFAVPYIVSDEIHYVLDPKLPPPTPQEIQAVTYVGLLAADCVSLEGKDRPTMTEVVSSLERALCACMRTPSGSISQWSGPCLSPG